jgi:hypothetical protein
MAHFTIAAWVVPLRVGGSLGRDTPFEAPFHQLRPRARPVGPVGVKAARGGFPSRGEAGRCVEPVQLHAVPCRVVAVHRGSGDPSGGPDPLHPAAVAVKCPGLRS